MNLMGCFETGHYCHINFAIQIQLGGGRPFTSFVSCYLCRMTSDDHWRWEFIHDAKEKALSVEIIPYIVF